MDRYAGITQSGARPAGTLSRMEAPAPLLVVCLCAEWCGVCREYAGGFEQLGRGFAGRARFEWIDIEEQSERLGTVEVDDFPTLLIGRGDAVHFFGAVLPIATLTERLVERALAGELPPLANATALRAVLRRAGDEKAAESG